MKVEMASGACRGGLHLGYAYVTFRTEERVPRIKAPSFLERDDVRIILCNERLV